jgi:hypothetical protein
MNVLGGLIALGLGINRWSIGKCLAEFKSLAVKVFQAKPLAKTSFIGWFMRLFYESIYDSDIVEAALKTCFSSTPLFGISRDDMSTLNSNYCSRVAITTTIDTDCRVFTNYHSSFQDPKFYLSPWTSVWET